MTPSAIRAAIKRKKDRILVLEGEICGLEKQLEESLPRKELWVFYGDDDYNFKVKTASGFKKVEKLHAWSTSIYLAQVLKDNNITHVVSEFANNETTDECIADGTYPVREYLNWWRRTESE